MHRESSMSKIASVMPALVLTLLFPAWQPTHCVVQAAEREGIVILVGPSEHPPGTHEVAAGGRVMEYALEHAGNVLGLPAEVLSAWPDDTRILQRAAAVVFIGDIFPPQRLPETARILEQLDAQAKDGLGIACVHYAVGLKGPDVAPDGDHPLLRWIGGYFANRTCPHHESFARVFERATIEPSATVHPIQRGWQPFVIHDEPYYNNYFGTEGNRPAENVTVVATSMLPPEAPRPEAVAWCVERPGGGRGFAVVMPHFYRNWKQDDLRRLILNGIVWTSGREVPEEGVRSELPDLRQFLPASAD
jgi:type 1 glutamine amidotransferase